MTSEASQYLDSETNTGRPTHETVLLIDAEQSEASGGLPSSPTRVCSRRCRSRCPAARRKSDRCRAEARPDLVVRESGSG